MARAASRHVVVLGSRRKARLEAIVRRASAPQALVLRARIVLLAVLPGALPLDPGSEGMFLRAS